MSGHILANTGFTCACAVHDCLRHNGGPKHYTLSFIASINTIISPPNKAHDFCRSSQQIRDIHPMLFQCWPTVFDAGPTLKQHWVNAPCLTGRCPSWGLLSGLHWAFQGAPLYSRPFLWSLLLSLALWGGFVAFVKDKSAHRARSAVVCVFGDHDGICDFYYPFPSNSQSQHEYIYIHK